MKAEALKAGDGRSTIQLFSAAVCVCVVLILCNQKCSMKKYLIDF